MGFIVLATGAGRCTAPFPLNYSHWTKEADLRPYVNGTFLWLLVAVGECFWCQESYSGIRLVE